LQFYYRFCGCCIRHCRTFREMYCRCTMAHSPEMCFLKPDPRRFQRFGVDFQVKASRRQFVFSFLFSTCCCFPKPSCGPTPKLLNQRLQKHSPTIFGCSPNPNLNNFVVNVIYNTLLRNPSCAPNLKTMASTAAETIRGLKAWQNVEYFWST